MVGVERKGGLEFEDGLVRLAVAVVEEREAQMGVRLGRGKLGGGSVPFGGGGVIALRLADTRHVHCRVDVARIDGEGKFVELPGRP
jgi:hypothetical protein